MSNQTPSLYDTVLYRGVALAQTHPDRLATLAMLHGMEPAPIEQCRVLELGCGNGSNLIPMAFGLPDAEFVGVDLAERPIAEARDTAQSLGLSNLNLHQLDLMDLSEELGPFDYIIAHGLYSWVPPDVQEKLLEICQVHLNPKGVAYISYNTYPGWHFYKASREMMQFHVENISDPQKRMQQGRAFLNFLRDGQPTSSSYQAFLEAEAQRIGPFPDWLMQHDLLADVNLPCYFHEFAERASNHRLQYLAEAEFGVMQARAFPPEVEQTLAQMQHEPLLREQYLDFLRGRSLRQTLLCHQDITLDRDALADRIPGVYVAAPIKELGFNEESGATTFQGVKGHTIETNHPMALAACRYLGDCWPDYIPFDELLDEVRDQGDANASKEEDTTLLSGILLDFYADHFIGLHTAIPPHATRVAPRPFASQAAVLTSKSSPIVPTLFHTSVRLDEVEQRLLPLLDGRHTKSALLKALGTHLPGSARSRKNAEYVDALNHILDGLMRHGLLMA